MFENLKRYKIEQGISPYRNEPYQEQLRSPFMRSRSHSSHSSNSSSISSASTSSGSIDFTSSLTSSITNHCFPYADEFPSSLQSEHENVIHNRTASDSFNSDIFMFSPSGKSASPLTNATRNENSSILSTTVKERSGSMSRVLGLKVSSSVDVGFPQKSNKLEQSFSNDELSDDSEASIEKDIQIEKTILENKKDKPSLKILTGIGKDGKIGKENKDGKESKDGIDVKDVIETTNSKSLHSNLTTNSNYRHSISFNKQQNHLYKIFLINHVQSNGNHDVVGSPSSKKNYISYIIEVHYQDRSILVQRRYSEFHSLYKYLKNTYPKFNITIPPKQILNNMSQQTIEKRKQGLKQFLWEVKQICVYSHDFDHHSSHSPHPHSHSRDNETKRERSVSKNTSPGHAFMWYHDPVVEKFFNLPKFLTNIYKIPNSIWNHIFDYLNFYDLYRNVALTSKWITRILYSHVQKATFSYQNQEIYFQSVAVAVDTIDELYDLAVRFSGVQHLIFERFDAIHNIFVERLVQQKSNVLKALEIRRCNVSKQLNLTGGGEHLQRISFAYCHKLERLVLSTIGHEVSRCRYLDLSSTKINDNSLKDVLRYMPHIETLILRNCFEIIEPSFETAAHSFGRLHLLDLSHCSSLRTIKMCKAKKLEILKIEYSGISSEGLQYIINQCENIQTIIANGCSNIVSLSIGSSSHVQQLQFAYCINIDPAQWRIISPHLQTIDFRMTPVSTINILKEIINMNDMIYEITGLVDENDPTIQVFNKTSEEPNIAPEQIKD